MPPGRYALFGALDDDAVVQRRIFMGKILNALVLGLGATPVSAATPIR
jgi:hypothetical protein